MASKTLPYTLETRRCNKVGADYPQQVIQERGDMIRVECIGCGRKTWRRKPT